LFIHLCETFVFVFDLVSLSFFSTGSNLFDMLPWVPPDPCEPGVQGNYMIMRRASGPSNLIAANLSGRDEFGVLYNIDVVLECKNHTFVSGHSGRSRVLEKVQVAPRHCLLELIDEGGVLVHAIWYLDMSMTQIVWL
jgi:hypothetical protein